MADFSNDITIETYKCDITTNVDGSRNITLSPDTGKGMMKECRKIYLVCDPDRILYVGEANTSIKQRFERGCTSYNWYIRHDKARGGYKGYKWLDPDKNRINSLTVYVVVFDKDYYTHEMRDLIEAVESEITFLIRQKDEKWPACQNEIHFHNSAGSQEMAAYIFEQVNKEIKSGK